MVLISYFLGQHYFKVNYQIKRIFGYVLLTAFIYFIYNFLQTDVFIIDTIFSLSLMVLFLLVIIKVEEIKINDFKNFIMR
jgi:hypothetical protein